MAHRAIDLPHEIPVGLLQAMLVYLDPEDVLEGQTLRIWRGGQPIGFVNTTKGACRLELIPDAT